MSTTLKKITTEAKRIRKKNPRVSWRSAVKQAGKKYRSGSIAGTKKRTVAKKRKAAGRVQVAANVGSVATAQSARIHLNQVLAYHQQTLANALMKKELAQTKTEKKQWSKKVTATKAAIKRLIELK